MGEIQALSSAKGGFAVLHRFAGWQLGMIHYTDGIEKASLERLEKHENTDELFILLAGEASLFAGVELQETPMEKNIVYNVPKGLWHTVVLSKDATVIVIENANTETIDKVKLVNNG